MRKLRVLSVVGKHFRGQVGAVEPMYLEFSLPLIAMGHEVAHFDHAEARRARGLEACGERFVATVKAGGFDVVLYQTAGQDWMPREAILEAGRHAPIVAWNSDDDWQWEGYSRHLAPSFTFMVTTYPKVFAANSAAFPNLLLSQWGCLDTYARFDRPKDLDFTFVGQVYGYRNPMCRILRRHAGLRAYGAGARLVRFGLPVFRGSSRIGWFSAGTIDDYADVNAIWNRSRISFTPLGSSADPSILQIKGRVFQMGLSGSLMLCDRCADLDAYYTDGKEYVSFDGLEDCVERARYLLAHEGERARIARAYFERTRGEHLWQDRFGALFASIGLAAG